MIGYEGNGKLVSAVCTLCGEFMPDEGPGEPSSKETIARFAEDFKIHICMKHGRYPVN
jgi:hypothetical protein